MEGGGHSGPFFFLFNKIKIDKEESIPYPIPFLVPGRMTVAFALVWAV